MKKYRIKVREVIRYDVEVVAPSAAAARFAINRPSEPQPDGIEITYQNDRVTSRISATHLEAME